MLWRTPWWWHQDGWDARLVRSALTPASWLYSLGLWLDRKASHPLAAALPTLVVGGVTAGGSGKTPVVHYIARRLQQLGQSPHIGLRGYGGRVSDPRQVLGGDTVDTVGDEALLHSALAPTWVGRDRLALAQLAAAAGASQLLLDDGMQHWRLSPTISLLVIDGSVGLGNGRLLPAGGLREPWAAVVARADALLILGEDSQQLAKCWPATKPLLRGQLVVEQAHQEAVANRRWLAFAGIGRPEKFWDSLRAVGAELAAVQAFADHHPYRAGEMEQLAHRADKLSAGLITTRKDWVRLPPEWQQRVQVLEVALQLDSDSLAAMDGLLQRLMDTSV